MLASQEGPRTRGWRGMHSPGTRLAAPVLHAATEEPQASVRRGGCAAAERRSRRGPGQERVVLGRHLQAGGRARLTAATPGPQRHAPPAASALPAALGPPSGRSPAGAPQTSGSPTTFLQGAPPGWPQIPRCPPFSQHRRCSLRHPTPNRVDQDSQSAPTNPGGALRAQWGPSDTSH